MQQQQPQQIKAKAPKKEKISNNKLFEDYANAIETKNEKSILESRNKIIIHNQPLVTHVINKYFSKNIRSKSTMQDLIQEGCFGLIEAIKRFKPDKGFKFSTYAAWWIRQAVNEALRENETPIVIPPHIINLQNKYIAMAQERGVSFEEALEQDYKKGLLSEKMMFSAIAAINGNKTLISIDGPSSASSAKGGNSSTAAQARANKVRDAMDQQDATNNEQSVDNAKLILTMKDALKKLGPKKRNALLLRFGIIEEPIKLKVETKVVNK